MKRTFSTVESLSIAPTVEILKRTKLSPPRERQRSDSDPVACSPTKSSSSQTPNSDEHDKVIDSASTHGPYNKFDGNAASPESCESSDTASDGDVIRTIGGPVKPQMQQQIIAAGARDLRARLSDFLPQLAQANASLGEPGAENNLEDVEEDDEHIEMNLGLGVLEHKPPDSTSSSDPNETDDDSSDGNKIDSPACDKLATPPGIEPQRRADSSVMAKLMGRRRPRQKRQIEDLS